MKKVPREVLESSWVELNRRENHAIRAELVKRLKNERPDIYTPFWAGAYTVNFSPDTHKAINASRDWLAAEYMQITCRVHADNIRVGDDLT